MAEQNGHGKLLMKYGGQIALEEVDIMEMKLWAILGIDAEGDYNLIPTIIGCNIRR
jgi:hypothetical protein